MSTDGSSCSICLEGLRNPRELPCHHSFCENCLKEYIDKLDKDEKVATKFDCPNCRTSTLPPNPSMPKVDWALQFPTFPKLESKGPEKRRTSVIISRTCNSCEYGGKQKEATRYCTVCREYVCEECFTFHKQFSATRNHEVIRMEEMGSVKTNFTKERCPCPKNKTLKHYCVDHDEVCCSECKKKHENCKCVRTIADVNEDLRIYGEIEKSLLRMNKIRNGFKEIVNLCEENQVSIEAEKTAAIREIQKVHADLKTLLAEIETAMIGEVNQLYQRTIENLSDKGETYSIALTEVETSATMLKSANDDSARDQTFLSYRRVQKDMAQFGNALQEVVKGTKSVKLHFEPSKELRDIQLNLKTFGKVVTLETEDVFPVEIFATKPLAYRNAQKIRSVKLLDKNTYVGYSDIVECSNKMMLVADFCNSQVLMVDMDGKFIDSCTVHRVWAIAVIGENEVALTTSDQKKIHFLSFNSRLTIVRTFATERSCHGIAYCRMTRELIVTTTNPDSVQILTLAGDVVKTIEKDNSGKKLFSCDTGYVAVNDMGNMLFVSDLRKGVIGVDRDGNVKFTYSKIDGPYGIKVDGNGNIYVCGRDSNDVHQLSPYGDNARVLLNQGDELKTPLGLWFNRRDDTFCLTFASGSVKCKELMLFQML